MLDLWVPEIRFAERFQQYYAAQGISVPAYEERLRCYERHIGLDALRFLRRRVMSVPTSGRASAFSRCWVNNG